MSYLTVKVDITDWGLETKLANAAMKAEHAVAVQAAKDTEDFVPMLTGSLKNRTQVADNLIIYPGPYARYLYYGKVMVDAATGKGPMRFTDKKGNDVIRFRKGATLRPTERNLDIKTTYHKNAQAFWFEASKRMNLGKWKRVAARAVTHFENR